jgi:hypothetical protein
MPFITRNYRGHLPVLKKGRVEVQAKSAEDRGEAILHAAYLAAREGFNAVIQAEVSFRKIRDGAYQKTAWDVRALPADLDLKKL